MSKHRGSTKWFSTAEAARLCGLSHMTIIRRFDAGDLKGFKVPGSRFRRIPRDSLVEFAARYGIPLELGREPSGPDIEEQPAGRPRRALVVEDDRRMATLIERVLGADGWEVKVARNGFDAGFLAGSFLPELIILDVLLPGIDGREACRQMRQDQRLAGSKILAVVNARND